MAQRDPLSLVHPTDALVGHAPAVDALRAQIRHLAPFDTVGNPSVPTLLLLGETGTGKGLLARVIHDSGPRAHGPFIAVNCAAIPETLLEVELFGFEAGTFTDARQAKVGLFEAASGGTLLLDEIEALPLVLQPKLLTAIEEKQVRRLGAVAVHPVDVKLMAATKEDLSSLAAAGRFRADLYHRLAVVLLELPPLRMRGEDSVLLGQHFVQHYAAAHGLPPKRLSARAEAWLQHYNWPGNVRELSHLMERVILLHPEAVVETSTLERLVLRQPLSAPGLEAVSVRAASAPPDEATRLHHALLQTGGNVARAARLLGLNRNTVRYRMRRYGITRPDGEVMLPPVSLPLPALAPPTPEAPEDTDTGVLAPAWEQKPVVVLVVTVTFPKDTGVTAVRYDSWTVAARWEQLLDDKIRGFGGVVLQRAPPVLTAVFGVPRTLEQLPQRAVQTALAIHHLATEARAQAREEPVPEVRVAAHLGTVLVDVNAPARAAQIVAVGDTFTVPVQLLGHTRAGDVLLSAPMGPQVEALYQLAARTLPLGPGASGAVAYTIIGPRSQLVPGTGWETRTRSPFVGRERELAVLHERLRQVEDSQGQVVEIVGEAGMGKSRLLEEFRGSLADKPVTYLEGQCLAYGSTTPYLPLRDLVLQHCGITALNHPEIVTAKIHGTLQELGLAVETWAPYLLALLGVHEGTEPLAALSPEAIRLRTFEVLRLLALLGSQQRPLILAVENLHWIDPTSEAYLASLVDHLARVPLLLLVTYRPECRPPWSMQPSVTRLPLPTLSPDDSRRVVQAATQTAALPAALTQEMVAKAEGNPFFLEELARALRPAQDGHAPLVTVPDTIQGVLMARIDRLPDAPKHCLQLAAVLGREVPHALLAALWDRPDAFEVQVQVLQQHEFLYLQASAAAPVYRFTHALTREVAYESLPLTRRDALHTAAGQALEALYADRLDEVYAHLAHHYARSPAVDKAVAYLTHMATRAVRSHAHAEAVLVWQEALTRLEARPAVSREPVAAWERQRLELSLRLAFSLSVLGRVREILALLLPYKESLAQLDDPRLRGPYYFRIGYTSYYLGEYVQAAQNAQQAVSAARQSADRVTLGQGHMLLALASYGSGRYLQAITYGQQAAALLAQTEEQHYRGMALWVVGFSHGHLGAFIAALEVLTQVETIGAVTEDPRLQSFVLWTSGWIRALQGEWEMGITLCQRALARAPGPFDTALAGGFLGQAYLEKPDPVLALPLLERAVQQFHQFPYRLGEARVLAWLGEAHLLLGRLPSARDLARQGLDLSKEIQFVYGVGLAQRTFGRIAQASDALAEAEQHLQDALQTFAAMQARFEVGRTHLALAALARVQGNYDILTACLLAAQQVFTTLQVPQYLQRTAHLAHECGVLLPVPVCDDTSHAT